MKKIILSGLCVVALVSSARGSHAYQTSPWCARFGGGSDYYENCNMPDFATCLGEIRGTGGNAVCSPNPSFRVEPSDPRRAQHRGNKNLSFR
jgi:hypothetical protein